MHTHDRYIPQDIERKWQIRWLDAKAFRTPATSTKPKFYILDMFPYPSGHGLHVGHLKGYIASDVVARHKRMRGFNVLHPMGWDSFGLPTERQAEKDGLAPQAVTRRNIDTFKRQLNLVGLGYDWEREFATSDAEYYRWTQWIFNLLFEKDLAYQAEVPVNWCPALGSVLANEEVQDGVCIDTGDPVERRSMRQWLLRITRYADRLAEDLDLVAWSSHVKELQRNWIGRSEGVLIRIRVPGTPLAFEVFSSRPETLFGCTFCALAPEHPLLPSLTTLGRKAALEAYLARSSALRERERQSGDLEKSGVFSGAYAWIPLVGREVPIWVSHLILPGSGTGAILGCPAHDLRDHAFAQAFGLEVRSVMAPEGPPLHPGEETLVPSGFLDGLRPLDARRRIIETLTSTGDGRPWVHYHLRDWLFSRQRYWGEPIPIVFVDGLAEADPRLPVLLPDPSALTASRSKPAEAAPPLAGARAWTRTNSAKSGRPAVRETQVMPQWAGSCWYYLRFIDPHNRERAFDPELERTWMPVDLYMGGTEHATLHLLYARFWHKVLFDAGLVSTEEPFRRLFNQGKVQARSFRDIKGRYYYPHEVVERGGLWFAPDGSGPLVTRIEKMSKSRYNVVSPEEVVAEHGADSLRLYSMFMGPVDQDQVWQKEGIAGTRRFLERLWNLSERTLEAPVQEEAPSTLRALHTLIRKVTDDLEQIHLNTAISHMMTFLNEAVKHPISLDSLSTFVRVLAPFAPHVAEELWERLGNPGLILEAPWPESDPIEVRSEPVSVVVQVNGRRRTQVMVPPGTPEAGVLQKALIHPMVAALAGGRSPSRVVFRPDRVINLVFPGSGDP